jgi:hypothetical protein
LVVAGAAVAASAAAAGLGGRRRLRKIGGDSGYGAVRSDDPGYIVALDPSYDRLIERDSAELPIVHSADPEIESTLSQDEPFGEPTSGAALFAEHDQRPRRGRDEAALDELWNATPGFAEGEQTEGYDAVSPEDWGAVWLERATQTTHEDRPHPSDPSEVPDIEGLSVSAASLSSSQPPDALEEEIVFDDDDLEPSGEHPASQR